MVVDDSATIRGLLIRALESDSEIEVIASVADGEMALGAVARHDVEVVVLDIEMPRLDGLTALPRLIAAKPGIQVIMASTLTRRNAEISLKALAAGAADYVTKPGASALTSAADFKRELLGKVKHLAEARRRVAGRALPGARTELAARPRGIVAPAPQRHALVALRAFAAERPQAIAIASSTGGPQALFTVLRGLHGIEQPVFITQHMPATFTTILAEHIGRSTGWRSTEAVDGEVAGGKRVYIAPGDFHMIAEGAAGAVTLRLSKAPQENFCRPSADPMLRSLAAIYGARLLVIVLTGMGHDGLAGCREVIAAGGSVMAQDEATSVVWGMPGAVAQAGLCSAVLPVAEIAPQATKIANGRRL